MYDVNCVHAFGRVGRQVKASSCASMALVISPWHMCEGYGSWFVCVHVFVTTLAGIYFVHQRRVTWYSLWRFLPWMLVRGEWH